MRTQNSAPSPGPVKDLSEKEGAVPLQRQGVGPGMPGRGPLPTTKAQPPSGAEVRAGHRLRDLRGGKWAAGTGEASACSCTQHPPAGLPVSSPGWTLPPPGLGGFVCWAFLDPHGPSCSSASSRKPSEPPRARLQGPQTGQPLR